MLTKSNHPAFLGLLPAAPTLGARTLAVSRPITEGRTHQAVWRVKPPKDSK